MNVLCIVHNFRTQSSPQLNRYDVKQVTSASGVKVYSITDHSGARISRQRRRFSEGQDDGHHTAVSNQRRKLQDQAP